MRFVRERLEDAADARTAAAWRAAHHAQRACAHSCGGVVMWAVTGWAVATWLKITVFLALGVGAAWLWCSPGWFAVGRHRRRAG